MKRLLVAAFLTVLPALVFADPLNPFGYVGQVTQQDGDTFSTLQVPVSSSTVTLLSAAVTNKTNRKRVFENCGSFAVWIGSNTSTLTSTGFRLSESTGTAPAYTTYDSAAIYALALANVTTDTVCVAQETNSNP